MHMNIDKHPTAHFLVHVHRHATIHNFIHTDVERHPPSNFLVHVSGQAPIQCVHSHPHRRAPTRKMSGTPTSMLAWVPDGRRQSCESHARQNIRLMCLSFVFLHQGAEPSIILKFTWEAVCTQRGSWRVVWCQGRPLVIDVSSVDHCRPVMFLHSTCVSCFPFCD